MFYRLILFILCFPLHATVFQKQSVDQQITEADGIVVGHFLRHQSVKLDDGTIATQMIFKMNKELGMQSEIFGMDEIIIHYPGGQIGEEGTYVAGVPKFVSGEKVVVMVKGHQDRFWGMNLGFGTFKVINYGNEKMIVNTIFPEDRGVGQISMEEFERKVRIIKGARMKVVLDGTFPMEKISDQIHRFPASAIGTGKNRAVASKTESEENTEGSQGINSAWLVVIFALMGGLFRLLQRRETE